MATRLLSKREHASLSAEEETRPKKAKPTPLRPLAKKYTQRELDDIARIRQQRYDSLLDCARRNDMSEFLILPTANRFELPMARVSYPLHVQVELLDIYHYLVKRKNDFCFTVTHESFGPLIGFHLPERTLVNWLHRETAIREASKKSPEGAHYIVKRKNMQLEQFLYQWLQDQQKERVSVDGKMSKQSVNVTYTILGDLEDDSGQTVSEVQPSFSAAWFDPIMKRNRITYCQFQEKAGSVDLEAIEPELVDIRHLCAQYTPDNIFNCDETGFYLTELDTGSFTMLRSKSGVEDNRAYRISVLFCINASGSSLTMADSMDSLKPLVIAKNFPREIEEDPGCNMAMATSESGWMTRDIFVAWLQILDDELSQPTLLLLDSANAHSNINMRDTENNVPWKHLYIRQLPKNSTTVTQPLDVGVVRAFKREFMEQIIQETYSIYNNDGMDCIPDGYAWALIPQAWSRIKAQTLRYCFAQTPILPTEMCEQLRQRPPTPVEQLPPQYSQRHEHNEQEGDNNTQELTEETQQQMDAEKDGQDDQSEKVGPGDPASPPITHEEWDKVAQTLKKLGAEHVLESVEDLKEIRRKTKHQSGKMLELRRSIEQLVRGCGAYNDGQE